MRILVIGKSGQVAHALAQVGAARSDEIICLGRNEIDLCSRRAIADAVSHYQPAAIINAAAHTAVDKAERDQDAAYALNLTAPRLLAEAAAANRTGFIHLSTDYVFNGTKPAPYTPDDAIGPVSVYGASKAAGEIAVRVANPAAVIIRTAWVYSETGSNFVKRMLELGAEREELRIVDDQIGNPTFADDIAHACLGLASHDKMRTGSAGGVHHFAGAGDITWYGFASAIFDKAKRSGRRTPARLLPITTDQYPTPARRPANSRLDCSSLEKAFGIASPTWQTALKACMGRLVVDSGRTDPPGATQA